MRTPKDWGQPCPISSAVIITDEAGQRERDSQYLTQSGKRVSFAAAHVRRSFLRPVRRSFSISALRKTKS